MNNMKLMHYPNNEHIFSHHNCLYYRNEVCEMKCYIFEYKCCSCNKS